MKRLRLGRGEYSDRAVTSLAVVEDLEVLEDGVGASASRTNSVRIVVATRQPTMERLKMSTTNATYPVPDQVAT